MKAELLGETLKIALFNLAKPRFNLSQELEIRRILCLKVFQQFV